MTESEKYNLATFHVQICKSFLFFWCDLRFAIAISGSRCMGLHRVKEEQGEEMS